jgi:hypothetical protein
MATRSSICLVAWPRLATAPLLCANNLTYNGSPVSRTAHIRCNLRNSEVKSCQLSSRAGA